MGPVSYEEARVMTRLQGGECHETRFMKVNGAERKVTSGLREEDGSRIIIRATFNEPKFQLSLAVMAVKRVQGQF